MKRWWSIIPIIYILLSRSFLILFDSFLTLGTYISQAACHLTIIFINSCASILLTRHHNANILNAKSSKPWEKWTNPSSKHISKLAKATKNTQNHTPKINLGIMNRRWEWEMDSILTARDRCCWCKKSRNYKWSSIIWNQFQWRCSANCTLSHTPTRRLSKSDHNGV